MGKSKYVSCRYSHCKHDDKKLLREEAEHSGNAYYHKDCYEEIVTLRQCIDTYVNHFEKDPIFTQLRSVINDIVYNKGYDPFFLLFALEYASAHNIPLRHIPGLYYIVKNDEIKKAWDARQKYVNRKNVVVENKDAEYIHIPNKTKGFADIIGG